MRRSLLCATLATSLVIAWQSLTVWYNYDRDWTALFHTGAFVQLPPALAAEDIYRFRNDPGYDGQFYRLVAHDPLLRRGYQPQVDNPHLRWRRILTPALAWCAALGQDAAVDYAYIAVTLAFVFAGSYWLSRYASHRAWGLAFPLIPAVLVSIDRMTVDAALAALCVGFALYLESPRKLYAVLALAPLARETGICLVASYCLWLAARRAWRPALAYATAALPFLAWTAFVHAQTAADHTRFLGYPFAGLLERTVHPASYALTSRWLRQAAALDYLAVLAVWLALALAARALFSRAATPLHLAAYSYAALAAVLGQQQIWSEAYSLSRTQTPLLLCLALAGGSRWGPAPLALSIPRILFQLGPQWKGILRGLLS
ncbi:MAG: hypothetical protein HY013_20835 [Candidatus Solibacter usitatus]|nr:hypothetical protein [Candidatus Solibacter usitatus]